MIFIRDNIVDLQTATYLHRYVYIECEYDFNGRYAVSWENV